MAGLFGKTGVYVDDGFGRFASIPAFGADFGAKHSDTLVTVPKNDRSALSSAYCAAQSERPPFFWRISAVRLTGKCQNG